MREILACWLYLILLSKGTYVRRAFWPSFWTTAEGSWSGGKAQGMMWSGCQAVVGSHSAAKDLEQ